MGTLQAKFLLDTQRKNSLNQNAEPKGRTKSVYLNKNQHSFFFVLKPEQAEMFSFNPRL